VLLAEKSLPGTNTPAYLYGALLAEKKNVYKIETSWVLPVMLNDIEELGVFS